jgi:hypothetical protein
VLKSDGFLRADRTTLVTILEQDQLRVSSELDLFSACLRWAKNHIQGTGSDLGIAETLGPALSLIRFRTMTAKEFATLVVPGKFLSKSEIADILCCILTETGDMPEGFSNNVNSRM